MNYSDLRTGQIRFRPYDLKFRSGKDVRPLNVSEFSFGEVLAGAIERSGDLKFSAHALKRLYSRNIRLNDREMMNLLDAVSKVESKNAKQSLLISDRAAFIVNVPNRTVITAIDREGMRENIFTNIDSAMVI